MKLTNNFNDEEFKCKCGKCNLSINKEFVEKLQFARTEARVPFKILSGCRCQDHNDNVGGVKNSAHTKCLAADIEISSRTKYIILNALRKVGFKRIGVADGFIHCDIDLSLPQTEWTY